MKGTKKSLLKKFWDKVGKWDTEVLLLMFIYTVLIFAFVNNGYIVSLEKEHSQHIEALEYQNKVLESRIEALEKN